MLPPERFPIGSNAEGVLTLNLRINDLACWMILLKLKIPKPGLIEAKSKFLSAIFSATLKFGTHALRKGSSGKQKTFAACKFFRVGEKGFPSTANEPLLIARCPLIPETSSLCPFPEIPAIPTI
jgi:hypothetical protein